jgi:hypothetical protein
MILDDPCVRRRQKHIVTMSQNLNLTNIELDQLSVFMGNEVRVHREYYSLPESTIQLVNIFKILIASEKGKLHQFKGNGNLDEFSIAMDEKISGSKKNVEMSECENGVESQRAEKENTSKETRSMTSAKIV